MLAEPFSHFSVTIFGNYKQKYQGLFSSAWLYEAKGILKRCNKHVIMCNKNGGNY